MAYWEMEKTVITIAASLMKRIARRPYGYIKTKYKCFANKSKHERRLEVGPGPHRVKDFETLDIFYSRGIDYVVNICKGTPFENNTFSVIYASHVVEHIPWFYLDRVFKELFRILRSGGVLEVWVPDGLKICRSLLDFEEKQINHIEKDGWYKFNEEKDPYKWINGRIFAYGDGSANPMSPNWHRSLFTERYLTNLFIKTGFPNVTRMGTDEVRGYDHGWINLGIKGVKP